MGPRDHRIHLGRRDSPKTPPQNHSSTKPSFSGPIFYPKKVPSPKCWPNPPKSPQRPILGTFPNHSKKNAQPILAKSWAESTPQSSKRSHGVKNTFFVFFHAKIQSLVLETQHLRIIFEVLDLHLGCLVLETHFPRKCSKNIDFYTVWEPAWYTKADPADPDNPADPAEMVHSWQFAP